MNIGKKYIIQNDAFKLSKNKIMLTFQINQNKLVYICIVHYVLCLYKEEKNNM